MRHEQTTVLAVGVSPAMARRIRGARDHDDEFRLLEARDQAEAVAFLEDVRPHVMIIDLAMGGGSPLAVADYATFRCPDVRIIYAVGEAQSGFADGSIFGLGTNAHGCVTPSMAEGDVAAYLAHHAMAHAA
jgi:DNA-binding NarL/FixJ family response regulator